MFRHNSFDSDLKASDGEFFKTTESEVIVELDTWRTFFKNESELPDSPTQALQKANEL